MSKLSVFFKTIKTPLTIALLSTSLNAAGLEIVRSLSNEWDSGFCENVKVINHSSSTITWNITYEADGDIYDIWNANYNLDGKYFHFNGVDWNKDVKPNESAEFGYCANKFNSGGDSNATGSNSGGDSNSSNGAGGEVEPPVSNIDVDYKSVLNASWLFYEAQKASGPFEKVKWRVPAALNDGSDVGVDLSKGWFDAGDHVKFNLPMAYSATMLEWGMLEAKDAYKKAGALDFAKKQIKYVLDYFLNAYNQRGVGSSDDIVYYQVGDPGADHAFWGPPQDMTMNRPTYSCDKNRPCSEVSAEMAAAMAAGYMIFKDENSTYANMLLEEAKGIYKFADTYKGNSGYTAANGYYTSFSGYWDELAWGAVWLYMATGDSSYLDKAKEYVQKAQNGLYWAQSWDNVSVGTYLLLAKITKQQQYFDKLDTHLNYWLYQLKKTPGGLAVLDQWGSLRYASTTAFIALSYSDIASEDKKQSYINFAKKQINYILGDNPRDASYVVGVGKNYPINPHHRAAHDSPTHSLDNPTNNRHLLIGALVGGPASTDDFDYKDDRHDYQRNEVATDYNAGFTSALAKLIMLDDNSSTIDSNTDSDNDGITDADEIKYGLDPQNPNDANQDSDGDGFSNIDEIKAGTNPNDKNDYPNSGNEDNNSNGNGEDNNNTDNSNQDNNSSSGNNDNNTTIPKLPKNIVTLNRDGWNLISVCKDIDANDVNMTNIEEIQNQNGESIYTGKWKEYSNLTKLKAGYGYWVKAKKGATFDIGKIVDKLEVPLQRDGWNLMAVCQDMPKEDIDMTNFQEIQNQNGLSIYTGEWMQYSNLNKLLKGYGVWVKGNSGVFFTSFKGLEIPKEYKYQTINNQGQIVEVIDNNSNKIKLFSKEQITPNQQANHIGVVVKINGQSTPIMQIQSDYLGKEVVVGVYNTEGKLIAVSEPIILSERTTIDIIIEGEN